MKLAGYTIRFRHLKGENLYPATIQRILHNVESPVEPEKIQAITICNVYHDNTETDVGESYAFASRSDQFNRATGRKVALTRAIAGLPKNERAAIWNDYLNQFPPSIR